MRHFVRNAGKDTTALRIEQLSHRLVRKENTLMSEPSTVRYVKLDTTVILTLLGTLMWCIVHIHGCLFYYIKV